MRLLTIGHSNHSAEHLVELIRAHEVQVVADIRSQPYSKYASQFDKEQLAGTLRDVGCKYVYLGHELGGRPAGEQFYDQQGHVRYDEVARSAFFAEGLARLEKGMSEYRVAILCAEENPAACHRKLLVSRVLVERGITVDHIRGDGSILPDAEMNENGSNQLALFDELQSPEWKSIPSVSPKKRLNNSSAA